MAADEKRRQIILGAEKLFTGLRYHEITMEQVARAAGVGKGTIYRYFQDKDDLFYQVLMSGFDELCEVLRDGVPRDLPPEEQLLHACQRISAFFHSRRQLLRLMQSEEGRALATRGRMHARWMVQRQRLLEAVADILRRMAEAGKIRTDLSAEVLASLILGMIRTQVREYGGGSEKLSHAQLVELFLHGAGLGRERNP